MANSNQVHVYKKVPYQRLPVVIFILSLLLLFAQLMSAQGQPPVDQPLVDLQSQASSSMPGPPPPPSAPLPTPSTDGGFHFSLSPYLWFAGAHGTVGALGRDVSIHASPGDLLSHFNFGLMGTAEASYNRLVLNGDLLWIRLSDDKALPFPGLGAVSADARVGQFVWTSKFGYRLINGDSMVKTTLVGAPPAKGNAASCAER